MDNSQFFLKYLAELFRSLGKVFFGLKCESEEMFSEVRSKTIVRRQIIPDVLQLGVVVSYEQSPSLFKVWEVWDSLLRQINSFPCRDLNDV